VSTGYDNLGDHFQATMDKAEMIGWLRARPDHRRDDRRALYDGAVPVRNHRADDRAGLQALARGPATGPGLQTVVDLRLVLLLAVVVTRYATLRLGWREQRKSIFVLYPRSPSAARLPRERRGWSRPVRRRQRREVRAMR
jgi:hypothetical protein